MKRIYLAGPYSTGDILKILDNIRNGQRMGTRALLAGLAPFVPWHDYQFQLQLQEKEKLTVEHYRQYSLEWLKVSEAVLVLPGWQDSKGTMIELAEARRLGIPIFYSLKALLFWAEQDERSKTWTH